MKKNLKASQVGIRTLREMPSGADNATHAWLLRGGFLYQHSSGIYCFTALMYRVEQKLSEIIADEITEEGGSHIRLPILQSAELWKETGRWGVYKHAKLMFQFEDRKGRDFGLSPTAEEACCDLAKHMITSAAQLPLNLFQQNMKFRDELRPRSGLLRSREFIMMDAYSFDIDDAGLDVSYRRMRKAYHAIFSKIGMRYITVEADSGAIGGAMSEEFMSISEIGEDTLLFNDGYAANVERARSTPTEPVRIADGEMEIVDTPDANTIEKVARHMGISPTAFIKSMVFELLHEDRKEPVLVLIRGDYSVNPIKLANHFGALEAEPASPETVEAVTGSKPGWVGPIGLKGEIRTIADESLKGLTSLASGCGQAGRHANRVCPGRDFPLPDFVDLRTAREGEIAPNGKPLETCKGIEVGHVFKLGDKYSKALNAGVTDSTQTFRHFQMGCYGIGTTRVISALIDQNCDDEKGIVWPLLVAPFHVHIVPLKADLMAAAEALGADLALAGVESLVDDRKGTAGALLKDTDIIGLPLRIIVGRDFQDGNVEFLNRIDGDKGLVARDAIVAKIAGLLGQAEHEAEVRKANAIAGQ